MSAAANQKVVDGSLFASGPRSQRQVTRLPFLLAEGALDAVRVIPVKDRDGNPQYLHDLTLVSADGRVLRCTMFHPYVVDLRSAVPTATAPGLLVQFEVIDVRPARDPRYGMDIGYGLPPVTLNGQLAAGIIQQYENRDLVIQYQPK